MSRQPLCTPTLKTCPAVLYPVAGPSFPVIRVCVGGCSCRASEVAGECRRRCFPSPPRPPPGHLPCCWPSWPLFILRPAHVAGSLPAAIHSQPLRPRGLGLKLAPGMAEARRLGPVCVPPCSPPPLAQSPAQHEAHSAASLPPFVPHSPMRLVPVTRPAAKRQWWLEGEAAGRPPRGRGNSGAPARIQSPAGCWLRRASGGSPARPCIPAGCRKAAAA